MNRNLQLLVRTPPPYRTESFWGYLARIAEANGYESARYLLAYAGIQRTDRAMRIATQKIAPLLGVSAQKLEHISNFGPVGFDQGEYYLLGQALGSHQHRQVLRLERSSFCPQCVLENGYIDAFFDLRCAIGCPIHRTELLSTCQECGTTIKWFRPGLLICTCGANLADSSLPPISEALSDFLLILLTKTHGKSIVDLSNSFAFPIADLDKVPLSSLIAVNSRLSAKYRNCHFRDLSAKEIVSDATEILSHWPLGFHRFLADIKKTSDTQEKHTVGLKNRYKELQSLFGKSHGLGDATLFLQKEFIRFGITQASECVLSDRNLMGVNQKKRFISLSDLSNLSGINRLTLIKRINDGTLPATRIGVGKNPKYIIDVEKLELPKYSLRNRISARDASHIIGISVSLLTELCRIKTFESDSKITLTKTGYQKDEVCRFLNRLIEKAPHITKEPDKKDAVTLDDILRHMKFGSTAYKAYFIDQYLSGHILPLGRTADDIVKVYFDRKIVYAYARNARFEASQEGISACMAARQIQCAETAIPALISGGHIAKAPKKGKFTYVTKASVTQFCANFQSLTPIARDLKTTVKRLIRLTLNKNLNLLQAHIGRNKHKAAFFISIADLSDLKAECESYPARLRVQK